MNYLDRFITAIERFAEAETVKAESVIEQNASVSTILGDLMAHLRELAGTAPTPYRPTVVDMPSSHDPAGDPSPSSPETIVHDPVQDPPADPSTAS